MSRTDHWALYHIPERSVCAFMCLGIPGTVLQVQKKQQWALLDSMGITIKAGIHLVDDVKPGDILMVHAGEALGKIDQGLADELITIWQRMKNTGYAPDV